MHEISEQMRALVGPPEYFDIIGAYQLYVLVDNGLREHHRMLDIGSGCLRAGRFFIMYLKKRGYVGIEPNTLLSYYGLKSELGSDLEESREPVIYSFPDFEICSKVPGRFDFVLAHSIITHTGPSLAEMIFMNAACVTGPGGTFLGTFFMGQDNRKEGWYGDEPLTYTFDTLSEWSRMAGFRLFDVQHHYHPLGQLWFVCRK